jgi:hypothetical protein
MFSTLHRMLAHMPLDGTSMQVKRSTPLGPMEERRGLLRGHDAS